jgi:hypothetical protein
MILFINILIAAWPNRKPKQPRPETRYGRRSPTATAFQGTPRHQFFEVLQLRPPGGKRRCLILVLGELEHVGGLVAVHQLEHLLFPIAGSIPDDDVRKDEIGAGFKHRKAETALNQRAQVARQGLFGGFNGVVFRAAKGYGDGTGGNSDFRRRIEAVKSDHLSPLPFGPLNMAQVFVGNPLQLVHDGNGHGSHVSGEPPFLMFICSYP